MAMLTNIPRALLFMLAICSHIVADDAPTLLNRNYSNLISGVVRLSTAATGQRLRCFRLRCDIVEDRSGGQGIHRINGDIHQYPAALRRDVDGQMLHRALIGIVEQTRDL